MDHITIVPRIPANAKYLSQEETVQILNISLKRFIFENDKNLENWNIKIRTANTHQNAFKAN